MYEEALMRGLAYRRNEREKHIKRKEQILRKDRLDNPPHRYDDRDLFGVITLPHKMDGEGVWLPHHIVDHRGKLNKGKIHCSCPLCSIKTRNKGRRRKTNSFYPSLNYKISDLKRKQRMDWDEKNWSKEEENFKSYLLNLLINDFWLSDSEILDILEYLA
jgi:hypothetical protein